MEKELGSRSRAEHSVSKRVPVKVLPAPDGRVRIADAVEEYIDLLWAENNHVAKTVRVKAQELGRFAEFCRVQRKKEQVADLDRYDMLAYRDWMYKDGYMPWTVRGDLMGATTMLKETRCSPSRVCSNRTTGPTSPTPNLRRTPMKRSRRCFARRTKKRRSSSGSCLAPECRNMGAAHLAMGRLRLCWENRVGSRQAAIRLETQDRAGTRRIPLSDSLIAALKAKRGAKDALVFPAKCGKVNRHLLRIIQRVAKRAGVEGAILHRCRDTWATNMLRQPDVDLFTLASGSVTRGLRL